MTHQQVDDIIILVFLAAVLFAIYRIARWMFRFRKKHGTGALVLTVGVITAGLFGGWKLFWMIEPHLPYLLGGTVVLWVIYANLFKESKKVERKKGFIETSFDILFPTVDQKIIDDEYNGYFIDEQNRQNGHYY